jgi:transglutaminase-like putative cysteine protease
MRATERPARKNGAHVLVRVGCQFRYQSVHPAPTVWQVRPRRDGRHRIVRESWQREHCQPSGSYLDLFGNTCDRLTFDQGLSSVRYDAVVDLPAGCDDTGEDATQRLVQDLPDETLLYLLPSRFCPSDELHDVALDLFGTAGTGWAGVQTVVDWVHDNIAFQYGASTPTTTAVDVFERRMGVCRDFAHLALTFCRCLNIPARYTFGYLPDIAVIPPATPMDFCAWFEAYLEDRWWTFDPRNNVPRIGRVVIGRGRDAVDVAMVTAYGQTTLVDMEVWADEIPASPPL